MDKSFSNDAVKLLKSAILFSKIITAINIVKKIIFICAAALTAAECLVIVKKLKN